MGRIGIRQGCEFDSRRLHYLSTVYAVSISIEESDCVFQRRWTQVHIHLGRHQIPVSCQFLDRLRRRPAHRQMRAEGVPQQVDTGLGEPCLSCSSVNESLDHLLRQRPPEGMGALDDGCSDRKVQNVCADSSVETPRHSGDFSRFSLSLTPQSMAKKFGTIRLLAMEVSRRRCESSEILLAPFGVSARPTSS